MNIQEINRNLHNCFDWVNRCFNSKVDIGDNCQYAVVYVDYLHCAIKVVKVTNDQNIAMEAYQHTRFTQKTCAMYDKGELL